MSEWLPVHIALRASNDDYAPRPRIGNRSSWKLDGHCNNYDLELFFSDEGRGKFTVRSVAQCRTICSGCPVRITCLTWALTTPEKHGIWAGTTGRQRTRILRAIAQGDITLEQVICDFREGRQKRYESLILDLGADATHE